MPGLGRGPGTTRMGDEATREVIAEWHAHGAQGLRGVGTGTCIAVRRRVLCGLSCHLEPPSARSRCTPGRTFKVMYVSARPLEARRDVYSAGCCEYRTLSRPVPYMSFRASTLIHDA